MAAAAWVAYHEGMEDILDGTVDWDTDTIKMILCEATYTPAATDTAVSNQLSTANGYTSGGVTLTCTALNSGGTITLDASDASWTASGGSIAAATAVIIKDATTQPLFYSVLNAGANITATTGNTFAVNINASGVATFAAA